MRFEHKFQRSPVSGSLEKKQTLPTRTGMNANLLVMNERVDKRKISAL
jgi:hypothetical protein